MQVTNNAILQLNNRVTILQSTVNELLQQDLDLSPILERLDEMFPEITGTLTAQDGEKKPINIKYTGRNSQGSNNQILALSKQIEILQDYLDQALVLKTKRIHNILGGDSWFGSPQDTTPDLQVNPESVVRNARNGMYPNDVGNSQSIQVNSLVGLLAAIEAVNHHRSGHYRLPAELPDSLTDREKEGLSKVPDLMSFLEWQLVQLDSIFGQFPVELKYTNEKGKEVNIQLPNIAESIAEVFGMLLGMSIDLDVAVELALKATIEAIKSGNSAMLAYDYSKANAEFLGYKLKEFVREVPLTITPGAENLRDALKESKQKMGGIENDDDTDLIEYLKRLSLSVEIVKSVFYRESGNRANIPGDRMAQDLKDEADRENAEWLEFLNRLRNAPSPFQRDETSPKPEIDDLSSELDEKK